MNIAIVQANVELAEISADNRRAGTKVPKAISLGKEVVHGVL